MLTNRFEVTFDYENINRDFDIYAVTKESKKLYKSNILDLPRAQFHARAVQYLWGATALVLFDKNTVQESVFRTTLQEKYPDAKVMRIDVLNEAERQKWFKKDNYLLLNLLINTLKSPKNQLFCYNNLTGALYYRRSEWKWKNYIWFLNIHFDYGMLLQLSVTTFMKAVKNGNYLFDENTGSFRKRLSDDDCHGELYSKHSYLKKHNTVDFIRYRDFQEFCKSKLGVMEQFLRDVKEKLGDYLTLQAALPGETTIVKPKKQNNSENNIKRVLADYSMNISDCVDSELSKDVIVQLVHRFWETYHVEVQIGNLQKGMLNLRIIHNENYYGDHEELHDPHEDDVSGYIVQHVTVEDFVSKKTGEVSKHGFQKIMEELLIKADNQQRKMTAFDWESLKLSHPYLFAVRRRDPDEADKKEYVYYQVQVNPDGSLDYVCFNSKEDVAFEKHEKMIQAYERLAEALLRQGSEIECVMSDGEGNFHAIGRTKEFTRPDTSVLYDALYQTQSKTVVPKEEFLGYLDEFIETHEAQKADALALKEQVMQYEDVLTKGNIHKMMNMKSNDNIILNRWLHEEYHLWIYSEFKSAASGTEMKNLEKLQYYPDKWDDNSFYYFVGSKNGAKDTVSRACTIRRVTSETTPITPDFLFSMLAVDFVRHGQYTVIPFPVKYLREYYKL